MYSASVGIGGLVGSRPTWSVQLRQRAPESIAFLDDRNQCALASVDDRPQLDKVQIQAIELVLGKDNALDDATPDSRDKLLATTMVQQFDKTFPQLFAAARTEVQIVETDGFSFMFRR